MTILLIGLAFAAAAPFVNRLGRNPARWAGIVWIVILLFAPLLVWTALSPLVDRDGNYETPVSWWGMLTSYALFWGSAVASAVARRVLTTLVAWRRRSR